MELLLLLVVLIFSGMAASVPVHDSSLRHGPPAVGDMYECRCYAHHPKKRDRWFEVKVLEIIEKEGEDGAAGKEVVTEEGVKKNRAMFVETHKVF